MLGRADRRSRSPGHRTSSRAHRNRRSRPRDRADDTPRAQGRSRASATVTCSIGGSRSSRSSASTASTPRSGTRTAAIRRTRSTTRRHIISIEHHLGIFHEETIQRWALHFKPLIITANYFYGSLHFIVTIGVAVWLFRKYSDDYPRYRNTLAITTALALIGFTVFPLMPPRLLGDVRLHTRFRRHAAALPDAVVVRLRARRRGSRTSSRRCRACTSRGPRGARSRWCPA